MKHRTDIDGLRAVAVLAVLGGHLKLAGMAGGFVGVDVFFVICGFLISRIVYEEAAAGQFSVVGFYGRRVRRIMPAFLVASLLTTAVAWVVFLPAEMVAFADSLVWSLAFLPNLYFHTHSGYFAPAAETLPLLHYWSLGVEEQFYLAFPLFVVLVDRFAHKLIMPLLVLGLAVSLAWAEYRTRGQLATAFYLPQFRAWELLTGSILALPRFPRCRNRVAGALAGLAGLGLIAGSVLLYAPTTPFPGLSAAPPCLGAALILWGGTGPVARLLSLPVLAYVGRISYSLYLVHWQVIVFSRHVFPFAGDLERIAGVTAVSMGLAALSYHLVE